MKLKNKLSFKWILLLYIGVLLVLSLSAVLYVQSLLRDYEACQPGKRVEEQIALLEQAANDGTLWEIFTLPTFEDCAYEDVDYAALYQSALSSGNLSYSLKAGAVAENSLVYNLTDGSHVYGEVTLTQVGEPVTKLAVFTFQDWKVSSTRIVAEAKDLTITAPHDFTVRVNGVTLSEAEREVQNDGTVKYTAENLYFEPKIQICDASGTEANYKRSGSRIVTEFYDYSLKLPSSLTVTLNGQSLLGTSAEDGLTDYEIRTLQKPEVTLTDAFGNTATFDGKSALPLTYKEIAAPDTFTVTVDGNAVPAALITSMENEEYLPLRDYTTGLPMINRYAIAILKEDAVIAVTDPKGNPVEIDPAQTSLDLTDVKSGDALPDEIASAVDVLEIAKKWSLYMSNDLGGNGRGFYEMASYIVKDSYLYNVAYRWANSIDITFISYHTLLDPTFTNLATENYVRLTDNAFSVEIRLDKNMNITGKGPMVDTMHSTFYFVNTDGQWKLVQIKEIVE